MRWVETRTCRRLTWQARALLALLLVALLVLWARQLHGFLAPYAPIDADILVIEGWMGDAQLKQAATRFLRDGDRLMLVTGAEMYRAGTAEPARNHADYAIRLLTRLGVPGDRLIEVSRPEVRIDRTWNTALAVRDWFRTQGHATPRFNLLSEDTHTARSWLVYRKAFADTGAEIGAIALARRDYDPARWWASSTGMRSIVTEFLGWLYVAVAFHP